MGGAGIGRGCAGRPAGGGSGCAGTRAGLAVLGDGGVLRRVRVGGAAEVLIDRAALVGQPDRLGAGAEDVRGRGGLDRRGDVQVGRCGQIDGRGQVEAEVDVGVHVEQGKHFFVRKRDGVLRLDLIHRYVFALVVHHGLLVLSARQLCQALRLVLPGGSGAQTG